MLSAKRNVGLVILGLCSLYFVLAGFHKESQQLHSFDFKPIYAGGRCFLEHCNPYSEQEAQAAYLRAGGDPDTRAFRDYNSDYPPSAFFLALPFAVLPWPAAKLLWLSLGVAVFILGAFLALDLCGQQQSLPLSVLMGLLITSSTVLVMLGQPAMLCIGGCCIAVWLLLRGRYPALAVVCFALSLAFKPHLCGLVWLYLLFCGPVMRKRAIQIAVLTVLLSLPGVIWASIMPEAQHWVHDLRVNIAGLTSNGHASDPGPRNPEVDKIASMQALVSLVRDDPSFYNPVTWGVSGVMLLGWLYAVIRMRPSRVRHALALATIVCISLIATYHRQYDTRLMLLCFPALAYLFAAGGAAATVAAGMSVVGLIATNYSYFTVVYPLWRFRYPTGALRTFLLLRPIPLFVFACAVLFLSYFVRAARADRILAETGGEESAAEVAPTGSTGL